MKRMAKVMAILALLVCTTPVMAEDSVPSNMIKEFSRCDANFFKYLNKHADYFKTALPVKKSNGVGHFIVKDRFVKNSASVDFKKKIVVNQLSASSYFEDYSDMGSMGKYYYWGFMIDSSNVEEVKEQLSGYIYDSSRLQKDGGVYARTEVKVLSSPWVRIRASNGPVGLSRVERMFAIEANPENDQVRVFCSIQGGVNADVLKEIRPDMELNEYPKTISKNLFDEIEVAPSVMAEAIRVQKLNPAMRPQFNKIRYSYLSKNPKQPKSSDETPVEIELDALPNGLIHRKEIYDPAFTVDRLLLADMFQLKSRMNGLGNGSVFLTTELKIDMPQTWNVGDEFKEYRKGEYRPKQIEDSAVEPTEGACVISNKIAAKTIFSTIQGTATIVDCNDKDGSKNQYAFLDNYGITLNQSYIDKKDGSVTVYKILQFEAN